MSIDDIVLDEDISLVEKILVVAGTLCFIYCEKKQNCVETRHLSPNPAEKQTEF